MAIALSLGILGVALALVGVLLGAAPALLRALIRKYVSAGARIEIHDALYRDVAAVCDNPSRARSY